MIWSIQYLRFFACLAVVVLHISKKSYLNSDVDFYFYIGDAGVDIFFIISGFIMMHISRGHMSAGKFLFDRIVRIYPIYLFILIPYLGIFLLHPELVNSHNPVEPSIFKSITLLPFIDGSLLNMVSWTLMYELYFYFIFTISIIFSARVNKILSTSFFIVGFLSIGLIFDIGFINSTIVLEFLMGMIYYKIFSNRMLFNTYISLCLIILGCAIFYNLPHEEMGVSGFSRLILWGGAVSLIFIGVLGLEDKIKNNKILLFLGNASYSTYLSHILVINAVYIGSKKYIPFDVSPSLIIVISTIGSFIIGSLIHKYIELHIVSLFKMKVKSLSIVQSIN